jgi:hypothetical protein
MDLRVHTAVVSPEAGEAAEMRRTLTGPEDEGDVPWMEPGFRASSIVIPWRRRSRKVGAPFSFCRKSRTAPNPSGSGGAQILFFRHRARSGVALRAGQDAGFSPQWHKGHAGSRKFLATELREDTEEEKRLPAPVDLVKTHVQI